jgi:hypothetical protein
VKNTHQASTPPEYKSVAEAASAYADGSIDNEGFVAAALAIPTVAQNPMPDREWFDDWPQIDGPLADLQGALTLKLISSDLYDTALHAMAKAGHDA